MSMAIRTAADGPSSVWRYPSFVKLLFTSLFLSLGNKVYEFTLPLLMYQMTHSSVSMSSMRTAELLPNLILGVLVGLIVDRVNKMKWARAMIILQVVVLAGLAAVSRAGLQTAAVYYLAGFLLMSFNYGYFNAQVSLTKYVVPTRLMTSANAKFSFVETFIGILGPAITGLVLMLSAISDGLLITATSYTACLLVLARFSSPVDAQPEPHQDLREALLEGWRALRGNHSFWRVTLFVVFLNSTSSVVSTTVVFYAKDTLQMSAGVLGIVLSAAGVGGLVGSLVMDSLRKRVRLGRVLGAAIVLWIGAYLAIYLMRGFVPLMVAMLIYGLAFSIYNISVYTWRHESTPQHLIGRVTGLTGSIFRIGMPITTYMSGWFIVWWGTASVFLSAAVLNAAVLLVYVKLRMHTLEPAQR